MEGVEQVTWHENILPRATLRALRFLADEAWLKDSPWYLAGGTALGLQVGHRQSEDLDFFTPESSFNAASLLAHLAADWETDILHEGTLYGRLLGAKVSFIAYPFFVPKEPLASYGAVRVLSSRDIAVMKIVAISQRGKKRDFLDLYWYVHHCEPLADILRRLPAQYPTVAHDYHHILKSIAYFEDAEEDVMPELRFKITWPEIKKYFEQEVPRVLKELVGLEEQ